MKNQDHKELNYFEYWTRRNFLKAAGVWAGAGILQPLFPLIGAGKSIAAAYPDEVLSIEKYTKGRVKPGMVISKSNAELVKDICTEGLYTELTRGREIKIDTTTLRVEAFTPQPWIEATLRNKGQAVLDNKGQLRSKDGRPWIGGTPFPEAKSALEIMWNQLINFRRYDDEVEPFREVVIDGSGTILRRVAGYFVTIYTNARTAVDPRPIVPAYKDELYRVGLTFVEPFDVYGLSIVTTGFYDAAKDIELTGYIPNLRRVRRLPSTQRFEPPGPYNVYYSSDISLHNDPILSWNWKLIETKPMLLPSPVNVGAFAPGATEKDFVFPYAENQKYPRTTWELRPEVVVVEGASDLPGNPYSRKRLYYDVITSRAVCAETWDKQGKLFKFMTYFFGSFEYAGGKANAEAGLSFANVQTDTHSNIWIFPEIGGVKFALNVGTKTEDWFTDRAMISRARR